MNSDQLFKFKTIVECQSMTRAAEQLFVTQSALSHSIAMLEEELNVKLFTRERKKLILTPEGRRLLYYANAVNDTLNQACLNVKGRDSLIITGNSACTAFLLMEYPEEDLRKVVIRDCEEDDMADLLRSGKIDIATCSDIYMRDAYRNNDIQSYQMMRNLVCREKLGIIVPPNHEYYDRTYVTLDDVWNCELCTRVEMNTLKNWMNGLELIEGRKFRVKYTLDRFSFDLLDEKIKVPELIIVNSIYNPDMAASLKGERKFVPINSPLAGRFVYMWYMANNKEKIEPVLQSLRHFYKNQVKDNNIFRGKA